MRLSWMLAIGLVCWPGLAVAGGHGFVFKEHAYYVVDFVLLFGGLTYLLRKKGWVQDFLGRRHDRIRAEMDKAMAARAESEARLGRIQDRLGKLATEAQDLRTSFQQDGVREQDRLLHEADQQALRLRRDGERRVAQKTAQLREDLEAEIAERALVLAREKVATRLTPTIHSEIVEQYIQDLGKLESIGA
jgi:F-type H+-transporting ATPase subunit b